MRKLLLIAGVAALAIPSIASAQPGCRAQQHDSRVAGTAVGAGLGALIGSQVAGHGSRGTGAVLGAVGGGALGNVVGGSSVTCATETGYYDDAGRWHASSGHYDADGVWVEGPRPAGDYGADVAYVGRSTDLAGRESWLADRISRGEDVGAITHYDADRDRSRLGSIRDMEGRLRDDHDGLTVDDRADIGARLDDLSASVNAQWRN